jgi:ketosteroid isomerase-like protein
LGATHVPASASDRLSLVIPRPGASVVTRWIDAFNAQDLDGMLACLSGNVVFRPLELLGFHGSYTGHAGVRRWFSDFQPLGRDHRLEITEVRCAADGQVVAVGALSLGEAHSVASICGLHRTANGKIVSLRHYFSDENTVRRLGLVA